MKPKILISLLTLACLLAVPATAQVNYAVSGGTAYVTYSPNASGNIVIASTYQGKPVTSIGDQAFYYCTSLTSVTIPNSVTNIGGAAFELCTSLTSVTIPSSVTNIGGGAFNVCTSLSAITVDALNSFYSSVDGVLFNKGQTALIAYPGGKGGSYAIPNSVTSIGGSAFSWCTSLTSITIGNSVTNIEYSAFYQCSSLTTVTIPNSVTSIKGQAFSACSNLTSVTIPNSVTNIGYSAFSFCTSLTSLTIPNSVTSIGGVAFTYCTSLTSVTIPGSVTSIGYAAFSSCTSLTSVTIPNSVTNVGISAFNSCTSLTNVTIPNSVTTIGNWAFYSCSNLTSVTFLGNAPTEGPDIFANVAAGATVYYYNGTTGWGPTYGGLPTVMLYPPPQAVTGSAGVKPGGFGFTINGVLNQTIVVEASTYLTNWQPIWTNTLSAGSTNFVDPQWLNYPRRFYRLRSN